MKPLPFKLLVYRALLFAVAFAFLTPNGSILRAQDAIFTYQGKLSEGGNPVQGQYDLTFTLFGASSGGIALAGPITNSSIGITNGLFAVALDFGANFPGADRWLEIAARTMAAQLSRPWVRDSKSPPYPTRYTRPMRRRQ